MHESSNSTFEHWIGFFQAEAGGAAPQEEQMGEDYSKDCYGNLPLIRSTEKNVHPLSKIKDCCPQVSEKKVWIRARLHTSRSKGKYALM